jgi:hypothetical protein
MKQNFTVRQGALDGVEARWVCRVYVSGIGSKGAISCAGASSGARSAMAGPRTGMAVGESFMVRAPRSSDPHTESSTWRVFACLRKGPPAYMARCIADTAVRMRRRPRNLIIVADLQGRERFQCVDCGHKRPAPK